MVLLAMLAHLIPATARADNWTLVLATEELRAVNIVDLTDTTLIVKNRQLTREVPISSIVKIIRRSNGEGASSGAFAGGAFGIGIGMVLSGGIGHPTSSGTQRMNGTIAFAALGAFIGAGIGALSYEETPFDLSAMDPPARREAIRKLMEAS